MDPRRLRAVVTAGAIAATVGVAVAVAADPLPQAPDADPAAALIAREVRAAERLAAAEAYLRGIADRPAAAAVVAVAPAPVAPVTTSASS